MPAVFPNAVKELNCQQHLIADSVQCFERTLASRENPATALADLTELVLFTKFHFAYEEKLLLASAYPLVEARVADHLNLFGHIDRLLQEIRGGLDADGSRARTIIDWISRQIADEAERNAQLFS